MSTRAPQAIDVCSDVDGADISRMQSGSLCHSSPRSSSPRRPSPRRADTDRRIFDELREIRGMVVALKDIVTSNGCRGGGRPGTMGLEDSMHPFMDGRPPVAKNKFQELLAKRVLKAKPRSNGLDNWRRTAALTNDLFSAPKPFDEEKRPVIPVPAFVLKKRMSDDVPPSSNCSTPLASSTKSLSIPLVDGPDADKDREKEKEKEKEKDRGKENDCDRDKEKDNAVDKEPTGDAIVSLVDTSASIAECPPRRPAAPRRRSSSRPSLRLSRARSTKRDEGDEGDEKKKKEGGAVLNPLKARNHEDATLFPNGPHKVVTDVLALFAILVEFLMVTWLISVNFQRSPVWYITCTLALTPVHLYWIHTNFRTAVLTGWILTDQFDAIKRHYLRTWFFFDILVSVPWDCFAALLNLTAFKITTGIRLLRILRVPWLLRRSNPVQDKPVWVQIVLTTFWSMVCLHLATCSWLSISTVHDQGFRTLVEMERDRFRQYIAALYWAVATITSTGYGDISGYSTNSRIISSFWMFFGVMVIVYGGAKVTQWMVVVDPFLLAEMDKKRQLYALMTHNNIPWKIQKSALSVYPVVLETSSHDYNSIIEELPRFLQDQIRLHVKLKLIRKVPIFKGVTEDCLVAVAQVTVPEFYALDSNVIEYGEKGSEMFFLEHGIVEIYTYNEDGAEIWMANLKGGSFFGEISLMSEDCRRTATVRAVTQCIMYTLTKESFDHVVSLYPDLKEEVEYEAKSRLEDIQLNLKSIERMKKATRLLHLQPHEYDSDAKKRWKRAVLQVILDKKKAFTPDDELATCPDVPTTDETSAPKIGTFVEPINYHPHIMLDDDAPSRAGSMAQGTWGGARTDLNHGVS